MLNNHCGVNRGSANKLTNLQEQSKPSNNQINTIQSAPLNNGNNHDNISSDNSEIQSLNNTLSGGAAMDEKQKMLLLKIANNSIAAASAVASVADIDYGNVSVSPRIPRSSFPANFLAARTSHTLDAISSLHPPARARGTHSTEHEIPLKQLSAKQKFHPRFSPFFFVYHSIHTRASVSTELCQFQPAESTDIDTATRLIRDVQRIRNPAHTADDSGATERQECLVSRKNDADWRWHMASEWNYLSASV
jgi:hypothetical protein